MSNIKVLYEDNHLIAVFKPVGVLSQGDKTGDVSILDEVKKYLKEKYKKPGNVFLGLLHRLDRPVSGIILFAKTSKGASRLSEQFRNHTVEKTYHAIVIGKPKENRGVLTNFLGKDEKLGKAKEYADGKESILYYEVINPVRGQGDSWTQQKNQTSNGVKSNTKYSLLQIKIEGGKFHQIRAQLSLAGFPILGDVKYKGEKWQDEKSIALCATNLNFQAATEGKKINLSIPMPEEWEKYIK